MVEHHVARGRCDADAGVSNAEANGKHRALRLRIGQATGAGRRWRRLHPHQHFAALGKLDGVREQVGQDLAQFERVAAHHVRQQHQFERQFESFCLRGLGKHQHGVFNQCAQIEFDRLAGHVSRFDLGEIEDVVDDVEQVPARALHRFGELARLKVQLAAQQQLRHAQHAIHGGADFMAHGGQERALGPAGRLGRFLRLHQFDGPARHFLFQVVAVRGQAGVAPLDLFEHAVQSLGQAVQFGNLGALGADAIVGVFGHLVEQRGQARQRLQQRRAQAREQDAGDDQRQQRGAERDQRLPAHLFVDRLQVQQQQQGAQGVAVVHHRLHQADGVEPVRHRLVQAGQRGDALSAFRHVARKQRQLPVVDGRHQHIGRMLQRLEQVARGALVMEHQGGPGVFRQHPRLGLAATDQGVQVDGETADNDDQRDQAERNAEGHLVDVA